VDAASIRQHTSAHVSIRQHTYKREVLGRNQLRLDAGVRCAYQV
jgi:hypothetical protein